MKKTAQPGSISHGTMRNEDLFKAFLTVLHSLDVETYRTFLKGHPELLQALCDAQCDIATTWWDSEQASNILLDELFDLMDAYSPEGYGFGRHPDDGSDYGYWPLKNDENIGEFQKELSKFILHCIAVIVSMVKNKGVEYSDYGGKNHILCLQGITKDGKMLLPSLVKVVDDSFGFIDSKHGIPLYINVFDNRGRVSLESEPENFELNLTVLSPGDLASLADYIKKMSKEDADACRRHVLDQFQDMNDIPVEISFQMNGRTISDKLAKEEIDDFHDGHWWHTLNTTEGINPDGMYQLYGETDEDGHPILSGMTVVAYDEYRNLIKDDIPVDW